MIWNSHDRTFEFYFGDARMQAFQAQQGELPAQAQRNLNVFVDASAGPENLLDATRLAAEMLPDYRLAIEREPYIPVINPDDFLFGEEDDDEEDDAVPFEPPPGGPSA
jgi:hypothetical protein